MNLIEYFNRAVNFSIYYQNMENIISSEDESIVYFKYYGLNYQRIQRLNKKIELTEEQIIQLKNISNKVKLLVITEGWCGDAAQILPIIQKMDEVSENIETRMIYRDENPDLMNQYLTNGGQSIPIVVGINEKGGEQFRWGPRPAFGMELLKQFKEGVISKDKFAIDLQKAYNKDKGNTIFKELLNLMK